jgi:hypothetical protein
MTRWRSGVVLVVALVAAGCGGTTAQIGTGASGLVPASAPAFIAVDTDPGSSQWRTIDALASRFPDKQKAIDSLKSDMRKQGVDWEQDVKPALGKELDFAWLDFENGGRDFVLLVQPQSESKFEAFVRKANASETDPSNRAVYDKFQGWEVVAPERSTIDRFEKASGSEAPLADQAAFKQSMDRLGGNSLVRAYVNGKFLMNLAHTYGGAQVQPYLDKLGTLDWIALRLGATSQGIGLDTIVHGTPGKLFKGVPTSSAFTPKLLGTVPEDALLYLTFHGSKGMFSGLQQNAFLNAPQYRQFERPLQQIGQVLEGENAVYVRPAGDSIPEVTFVAEPAKGLDGTALLDRLVRRYAHSVPTVQYVNGAEVHGLASGSGVGLYYANVGDKLVVTDHAGGIKRLGNGKALGDSGDFKDTKDASGLPGKSYGFLYVNISSSVPLVEKLAHSKLPAEIARNVKPLHSAIEYAVSHSHEFQVTFFLRIK